MKEEQADCCYICGTKTKLVIDHNHNTKKVRKMLCSSCNLGLGKFGEHPKLLRAAAAYCEAFNVGS